ncbi:MAG: hypothetical protein MAG581_01548 [Deltaproteobacteria bacterium]|nr:hypothetical protein [Deltaproteobacteria bacterium]
MLALLCDFTYNKSDKLQAFDFTDLLIIKQSEFLH